MTAQQIIDKDKAELLAKRYLIVTDDADASAVAEFLRVFDAWVESPDPGSGLLFDRVREARAQIADLLSMSEEEAKMLTIMIDAIRFIVTSGAPGFRIPDAVIKEAAVDAMRAIVAYKRNPQS